MSDFNRRSLLHGTAILGAAGLGATLQAHGQDAREVGRRLTDEQLSYLRRFDTPTIANALEIESLHKIHGRSRTEGFMSPQIRCVFPDMGIINGYAATATIQASKPGVEGGAYVTQTDYWKYVDSVPKPTVVVIHDLDAPIPVGSWWGEVNANVHRTLGCVGVITDGGVRDLSVTRPLGFHYFAAEVLVSHGYVRVVDFGKPVDVGGVTVDSGDLLQADEHGVIHIPDSVAPMVGPACYDVFKSERALIELCQTPGASLQTLLEFARNQ